MRKFILWAACLGLCLTGCAAEELPAETEASTELSEETLPVMAEGGMVYVSIGDSIARGYGLANIAEERFSAVAAGYWDGPVAEYNYGVDGQTSGELLDALDEYPALSDADVISVSIGANNVLQYASQFLYEYYLYLYADPVQYDDAAIGERFRVFTAGADEGCDIFLEDVPALLTALREINPDCQIQFLTLYNPYEAMNTILNVNGLPVQLAALADTYVSRINECIRTGVETFGDASVTVVDVYGAFSGRGAELVHAHTAADADPYELDMSTVDPHPNARGHKVIGRLVADAYTE